MEPSIVTQNCYMHPYRIPLANSTQLSNLMILRSHVLSTHGIEASVPELGSDGADQEPSCSNCGDGGERFEELQWDLAVSTSLFPFNGQGDGIKSLAAWLD
jgi:hypothetical protein